VIRPAQPAQAGRESINFVVTFASAFATLHADPG
jgi:hypothetical protein